MKKIILTFGFSIVSVFCSAQFTSSELRKNFSTKEISELEIINSFFLSQICENNQKKFSSCFKDNYWEIVSTGISPLIEKLDYEKQLELYKKISKNTFKEIWNFEKLTRNVNGIWKDYKSIGFNVFGKYQKFLKDVSLKNSQIENYLESIENSGTFENIDTFQQRFHLYPRDFDLDDPNIQLIISIQYLTGKDYFSRTDEWKLE